MQSPELKKQLSSDESLRAAEELVKAMYICCTETSGNLMFELTAQTKREMASTIIEKPEMLEWFFSTDKPSIRH